MSRVLLLRLLALSLIAAPSTVQAQDSIGFDCFKRSLNTTSWGYEIGPAPLPQSAPSTIAERFEVRPGDCGVEPHWNDCASDRERSELSEQGRLSPVGSSYWYGWSIYVPNEFPAIEPAKTILGQFHQKSSHVVFLFRLYNGGYWLDDMRTGKTAQLHELIPAQEFRGRWHRIWIEAKWSADGDGFFDVYVNGKRALQLKGGTAPGAGDIYMKYGVYRAFVSRYTGQTGEAPPTQIAYYTKLRKGPTRNDVR